MWVFIIRRQLKPPSGIYAPCFYVKRNSSVLDADFTPFARKAVSEPSSESQIGRVFEGVVRAPPFTSLCASEPSSPCTRCDASTSRLLSQRHPIHWTSSNRKSPSTRCGCRLWESDVNHYPQRTIWIPHTPPPWPLGECCSFKRPFSWKWQTFT